jgi:hypothetical protein
MGVYQHHRADAGVDDPPRGSGCGRIRARALAAVASLPTSIRSRAHHDQVRPPRAGNRHDLLPRILSLHEKALYNHAFGNLPRRFRQQRIRFHAEHGAQGVALIGTLRRNQRTSGADNMQQRYNRAVPHRDPSCQPKDILGVFVDIQGHQHPLVNLALAQPGAVRRWSINFRPNIIEAVKAHGSSVGLGAVWHAISSSIVETAHQFGDIRFQ